MATLVHVDGLRGINLDLIAEWQYEGKKVSMSKRSGEGEDTGACMRITFATGAKAEFSGSAAEALHKWFITNSRSLT